MKLKAELTDAVTFGRTIKRISHEIIEKNKDISLVCLVGIKTRGVPLAKRIADLIFQIEGKMPEVGVLDISMYRDDLLKENVCVPKADFGGFPFDVNGKIVILVDDVICTGRTARAAMEAVIACGRPAKIQLAAFVDRGHRELPVRPDYIGKNVPTSGEELVKLCIKEIDGADKVELYSAE